MFVSPVRLLQLLLLQKDTEHVDGFYSAAGDRVSYSTVAATLYECVTVSDCEMAETNILPCTPHPFWPCSSARQHHKWRHQVSWREGRKWEYYSRKTKVESGTKWQHTVGSATVLYRMTDDGWTSAETLMDQKRSELVFTHHITAAQRVTHQSEGRDANSCPTGLWCK